MRIFRPPQEGWAPAAACCGRLRGGQRARAQKLEMELQAAAQDARDAQLAVGAAEAAADRVAAAADELLREGKRLQEMAAAMRRRRGGEKGKPPEEGSSRHDDARGKGGRSPKELPATNVFVD